MSETRIPRPARPRRDRLREVALNIGAVAGLVCLAVAAVSMFLGVTPLVFRSGSMAPTITTGALALSVPVSGDRLEVGDVVSVVDSDTRITHRVTSVTPVGDGSVRVILRGDANGADDAAPYLLSEVDRVFFYVNGLGYAVAWLSSPVAIFLGGMLAGGLCVVAFARTSRGGDGPELPAEHGSGDTWMREGAGNG